MSSKGLFHKDVVRQAIEEVAKINDKGWMSFMLQPVIKKDDISEVVLVGMIVKEEELKEDGFNANIFIIETFYGDEEFELPEEIKQLGFNNPKQQHEILEQDFTYDHIIKVALGKAPAKSIVEVLIADWFTLLVNEKMQTQNFQKLTNEIGSIKYFK